MATIGYTGIAANTATTDINWNVEALIGAAYRYTAVAGDVVSQVAVYGGGTGGCQVGVYVWNGTVPTTRVGSAVPISVGASTGWHTAAASITLSAGTTYVVAIDYYDGANWDMRYEDTGALAASTTTVPELPSTWSQTGTSNFRTSCYATVGVPSIALTVANCSHAHTADSPTLVIPGQLAMVDAVHTHTASVVALPFVDFTDNFNRANTTSGTANALGANWNVPANSWYINSNTATKVTGDHYIRWVEPLPSVDHFIEVDVLKSQIGQFMWFHLRAPNNNPGEVVPLASYEAGLNTTSGGGGTSQCELGIVHANATYTVLGRADVTYGGAGAYAKLRLEAVGSTIKLYVDDILHITATDSELTGTYVGLNCFTGTTGGVTYDNFRAGLVVPPPIPLTVDNCAHTHTVDVPGLFTPGVLTMSASTHAHTASVPALVRQITLRVPTTVAGRKWLDQRGNVYLMRTFSSWAMAQNLTNAEITEALEGLEAAGFNSATICLGGGIGGGEFGAGWHRDTNAAGQAFWTGSPWQLATPSSSLGAAWSSVDWAVSECERLGMTINLSIFYSWGTNGAAIDINAATVTHLYNVGHAVATRYAASSNIVWHVMFDDGTNIGTSGGQRIDAYFHGINDVEGASTRLRWTEPTNGGNVFTQLAGFTYANWSANGWYDYGGSSTELAEASWNQSGATTIPTGDVEPLYDGHSSTGQSLRYRTYAVFLEGGMYENYGHEDWWPFKTPNPFGFTEGLVWQQVPADVHTIQQSYIWPVLDTYVATPDWTPASSWLTAGEGSGGDKAAVGSSSNAAVVYFPSNSGRATVTVNTDALTGSGNVKIRWYDPFRTDRGNAWTVVAASEAPSTSRTVTYPTLSRGDSSTDMVLIVENLAWVLTVANASHAQTASPPALVSVPLNMRIGAIPIDSTKIGANTVGKVMIGTTQVWP